MGAKKYKVWVQVEEIDEDEDTHEDIGLPFLVAEFVSLEAAASFAEELSSSGGC